MTEIDQNVTVQPMAERLQDITIIPITNAEEQFAPQISTLSRKYISSYSGRPNRDILTEFARKNLEKVLDNLWQDPGFGGVLAEIKGEIVGMTIYTSKMITKNPDSMKAEKSNPLVQFVTDQLQTYPQMLLVYLEHTFVEKDYQGHHISTDMRTRVIDDIAQAHPQTPILFVTSINENNTPIKISSEHLGFSPTGIKDTPDEMSNGYWYKVIPPQSEIFLPPPTQ